MLVGNIVTLILSKELRSSGGNCVSRPASKSLS